VSATKGIVKEKQTDETERNTVEINLPQFMKNAGKR